MVKDHRAGQHLVFVILGIAVLARVCLVRRTGRSFYAPWSLPCVRRAARATPQQQMMTTVMKKPAAGAMSPCDGGQYLEINEWYAVAGGGDGDCDCCCC